MKNKYTKEKQLVKDLIKDLQGEIKENKQEIKSRIADEEWYEVKHLEDVNDRLKFAVDEIQDFVKGVFNRVSYEFEPEDLKWVLMSLDAEIKFVKEERKLLIKHKDFLHVPKFESQITCLEYVIDLLKGVFKNV